MNKLSAIDYPLLRLHKLNESAIKSIPELMQRTQFMHDIKSGQFVETYRKHAQLSSNHILNKRENKGFIPNEQLKVVVEAGLMTFLLHCEARFASSVGQGFYTIGPCGEELLSAVGTQFLAKDVSALHYRHVGTSIARQLIAGRTVDEITLDRARGYTCSVHDPITGGRHCAIGGMPTDFYVSSTLASQAPPAVGRALAIPLSNRLLGAEHAKFAANSLSYVSVGDGSINNAHFLAAVNLSKYLQHRQFKCPVVFGITDNQRCISLAGHGYVSKFVKESGLPSFIGNGWNVDDVYTATKQAFEYSRTGRPSILLINGLPRRFGHAATDRQIAYMTANQITEQAEQNPLADACALAIERNVFTHAELSTKVESIQKSVEEAFNKAVNEPKITDLAALAATNSQPRTTTVSLSGRRLVGNAGVAAGPGIDAMRKHMTKLYEELLTTYSNSVYIGEDVQHGGYYLVTDGLASKFPGRVLDFPPDETTLVGAAMGMAQAELVPILEIPYAKYLDCAADMFSELCALNWLTAGKQPCGVLVRLQGFDKGIFGGNYHTHNSLNIPPGLDVVCFSNGEDYVRGIRYCMKQAAAGRVVMSVDSTDLLNRRHLGEKDDFFLRRYPADSEEDLGFDDIIIYDSTVTSSNSSGKGKKHICIVSYGNGVPTSLLAARKLQEQMDVKVTVVDSPYLSSPPAQLQTLLQDSKFDGVVFADVCKQGAGMPLVGIAVALVNENKLQSPWRVTGAANTYNPLGNTLTFLNAEQIIAQCKIFL